MKRDLVTLCVTVVVMLLQMTVVPIITDYNIMLPLVYFAGLIIYSPFRTILINAFVIGVMQDNMSVGMYGFHIFTILFLAYLFIVIKENVGIEEGYFPFAMTAAFLTIYNIIFVIWCLVLGYVVFSWLGIITKTFVEIIVSLIFVYPFNRLAMKLDNIFDADA